MEPIRFEAGRLLLIDQRCLPSQQTWVACTNAVETAAAIRDMVVRGAPAIGVTAAFGVALEAGVAAAALPDLQAFLQHMSNACIVLAESRPTAVNLRWAVERQQALMQTAIAHATAPTPEQLAALLLQAAHQMREDDIALNRRLGVHGQSLLPDGARVLTHCNAGALACAGYGTALGVIRAAVEAGKRISVVADETRPFLQGARLTAWELMQDGIDVTLIADNMAGHLMATGQIDAVVVGTDRVAANGDVVNKIGTYMVAVLAHRHGIPFHVACPLSTLDLRTPTGADVPIEERSASEVTGHGATHWAPAGVKVRNPAFDVTPAELVSSIITEAGVIHAPATCNLQQWFEAVSAGGGLS
jgi:methylthioribose-1-phosphate isomerase